MKKNVLIYLVIIFELCFHVENLSYLQTSTPLHLKGLYVTKDKNYG